MKDRGDVAVVGGGPCGVAAAIQLARSGIRPLLFERRDIGGLLHNANLVENYPGISRGISGPRLCRLLARHLAAAGIEPLVEEVVDIEREENSYRVTTDSGRIALVAAVVAATGTTPATGFFDGEEELAGRCVFYEVRDVPVGAVCRRAAVLGAGDAAYDYSLNLASRGYSVVMLQRSGPSCLPVLDQRARSCPDIVMMDNVEVTGCREKNRAIEIALAGNAGSRLLDADFLLVACGRVPENRLLGLFDARQAAGTTCKNSGTRSLPAGFYTGGDLVRGSFRQAGISVGDGLLAAMAAAEYVNRLKND